MLARSYQVMAGITHASSTGRECDVTRLLKLIEEHRHRGSGEARENQCDDKNSHGVPQQSFRPSILWASVLRKASYPLSRFRRRVALEMSFENDAVREVASVPR